MAKKSWVEKLNNSRDLPKVLPLKGKMIKRFGKGKITIPSPLCVDARMRKVRKGRLITIDVIRESIAREHKADVT